MLVYRFTIAGNVEHDLTEAGSLVTKHCHVPNSANIKILSICQDIMYARGKGTKPTPKALALGLTLEHLTGSKHLSSLMSRLGRNISYDTTMHLETEIALHQALKKDCIPNGFNKRKFTMLIHDNIDLAEETLSGAGSTHHTNGIMVQLKDEDQRPMIPSSSAYPSFRSGARSFKSSARAIELFS